MRNACIVVLLAASFFIGSIPLPVQADIDGNSAVIFMYHRFGEEKYPSTNITLEQFEQQLDYLAENNFTVLPLTEIIDAITNARPLPDLSVAITIDDAYLSVYEHAYPMLKARKFPFTVFVATEGVDRKLPAFMNWDQIREMAEDMVIFANHGHSHAHLVRREAGETQEDWLSRIRGDLEMGEQRLTEELGSSPPLFAYPFGEYNLELLELVDSMGYTGFGQQSGPVGPLSDIRALPRFPMAESFAEIKSFATKARSLPLPVTSTNPVDPVTHESRPTLTVSLEEGGADLARLACYSGAESMKIEWLEKPAQFKVQAQKPLPEGRSRYNCTAPAKKDGTNRYYWFSHPWLRGTSN